MRPLMLRKHPLVLGEQRATGEIILAYSLGQIVGPVIKGKHVRWRLCALRWGCSW